MQGFTARRQGCHISIGNNGRIINFCRSIIADQVYSYITANACILSSRCTDTYRSQLSNRIAFCNKIICFICAAFDFCFSVCVDFVYGNAKACCCILGNCTHNTDGSNFRCSVCRCLNIAFCSIIGIYISIFQLGLCFFFNQSCRTATAERKITRCNRNTCRNSRQRGFIYGINADLAIVSSGNISIINRCSIALLAAGQCTDIIDCYTAADGCLGTFAGSNTYITDNRQLVAIIRGLHCHLAHIVKLRASALCFRIFAVIFVNNSFYVILTLVNNNHAVQSSFGRTCGNCCADAVHVTLVGCIYSKSAACTIHATDFAALDISAGIIVQGIVGNSQACAKLGFLAASSAYLSSNIHCQSAAFGLYISFRRNKLAVFNSCRNIVIQRLPVSTAAYAEAACGSGNTGRKACQYSMACRINVRADQFVTVGFAGSCNSAVLNLSIIIIVNIADSYRCSCAAAVVTGGNAYAYRACNNHIATAGSINLGRLIAVAAFICCILNLRQVGRAISIKAAILEIINLLVGRIFGIIGCNIQAFAGQCYALNRCVSIVIQFIVGGIAGERIGGIGAACYTHVGSYANLRHIGSSFDISSANLIISTIQNGRLHVILQRTVGHSRTAYKSVTATNRNAGIHAAGYLDIVIKSCIGNRGFIFTADIFGVHLIILQQCISSIIRNIYRRIDGSSNIRATVAAGILCQRQAQACSCQRAGFLRIVDNRSSVFNFAVADYRQGLRINIIYCNSTAKGCIMAVRIIVLSQLLPGDACSTTGSHHHSAVFGSYSDILILSSILGNIDFNIVYKRTGIAIQQINCCAACTSNSYRGLLPGRSSGRLLVSRQYRLRCGLTVHQAVNLACYLMVKCIELIFKCLSLVAYKSAQFVTNTNFTTVISGRRATGNSYVDNFAAGFSINLKRACIDRAFSALSSLGAEEVCLLGIINIFAVSVLITISALTQTGGILHQLLQSCMLFVSSIRQLLSFLAAVRIRVLIRRRSSIDVIIAAFSLLSCSR